MLIISRKKDQKIIIADDIEITVLEVGRSRVRFGIKAPKHVTIHTRMEQLPNSLEEEPKTTGETPPLDPKPVHVYAAAAGVRKRL